MAKDTRRRVNKGTKEDGRKENGKHLPIVNAKTRFEKGHIPQNIGVRGLRKRLEERGIDREMVNERLADLLTSNVKQLNEIKIDEETTMLELIGISTIEAAHRNADTSRFQFLLDKVIGKEVTVSKTENVNINVESQVTKEDKEDYISALTDRAKAIADANGRKPK